MPFASCSAVTGRVSPKSRRTPTPRVTRLSGSAPRARRWRSRRSVGVLHRPSTNGVARIGCAWVSSPKRKTPAARERDGRRQLHGARVPCGPRHAIGEDDHPRRVWFERELHDGSAGGRASGGTGEWRPSSGPRIPRHGSARGTSRPCARRRWTCSPRSTTLSTNGRRRCTKPTSGAAGVKRTSGSSASRSVSASAVRSSVATWPRAAGAWKRTSRRPLHARVLVSRGQESRRAGRHAPRRHDHAACAHEPVEQTRASPAAYAQHREESPRG